MDAIVNRIWHPTSTRPPIDHLSPCRGGAITGDAQRAGISDGGRVEVSRLQMEVVN